VAQFDKAYGIHHEYPQRWFKNQFYVWQRHRWRLMRDESLREVKQDEGISTQQSRNVFLSVPYGRIPAVENARGLINSTKRSKATALKCFKPNCA
jgi:hypothetical protein